MTREQLVEAAKAKAQVMGWDAIAEDDGSIVQMLLSAEGASDQMVIGPLSTLRRELSALGVPGDYPAIEEYDLEADEFPEPALVKQDGSWTEEAERLASPGKLPAGPDGEDAPDIEPPQEEAKEAVEMDVSLKELYRALMGHTDQDTGGIPRPKQKVAVRASSAFYVKGLHENGKPFSSGIYRSVEKAKNGARGAVAAGLQEVRVVRLHA